jgi:hypothetical protein
LGGVKRPEILGLMDREMRLDMAVCQVPVIQEVALAAGVEVALAAVVEVALAGVEVALAAVVEVALAGVEAGSK